jgi:hypothetical protein
MVRADTLEDARICWAVVNLPIGCVDDTSGCSIERNGYGFNVIDPDDNLIAREPSLFAARYKILARAGEALKKGN